ncbi:protein arginine methyltransferase NDUFAF7, mitochondrial [Ctenocephalides felis]|uniref:protein arginine methyltransferase NDUFAF7, mitochondrial n=1 Tax=Ctenocephalides felis TaxID=7515 RepID=UPI000E6E1CF5|nr:protein arginine methyltransferase NDUFAF7, mitochondrial [Ctenocephalides felis]
MFGMQRQRQILKSLKLFNDSLRTCYVQVKRPNLLDLPPADESNLVKSKIPLSTVLWNKIKATGPITVAEYMKEALTNPISGYYMHNDVFGQKGDFITSPEISQMFGEIIAIWFLNECKNVRAPPIIQIVELGPGRGTLAKDILRVFHHFGFSNKISLHLVEVSPYLIAAQSRLLCMHSSISSNPKNTFVRSGETSNSVPVYWYNDIKDVPKKFSVILAHEFFDALPIHKLQNTPSGLREVLVDIDAEKPNTFRYVLANNDTPASKMCTQPLEGKDQIEISPQRNVIVDHLASRIEEDGGMVLITDYGHNGDQGDTFRSYKSNKQHDPLIDPGTADLTADIDFSQIKRIAEANERCITFGPVTQRDFLKRMGIDVRLKMLLKKAPKQTVDSLTSGYSMIVDKEQMGERFKFFCMFPNVLRCQLKESPVCGFS